MHYPPILKPILMRIDSPTFPVEGREYSQSTFLDDVLWSSPKWRESGDRAEMLEDAVERYEAARDAGEPFWEWSDDQQKVASEVLGNASPSGVYARQTARFFKGILRAPMKKPEKVGH